MKVYVITRKNMRRPLRDTRGNIFLFKSKKAAKPFLAGDEELREAELTIGKKA